MHPDIFLINETYLKTGSTLFENIEWKMLQESVREGSKFILNVVGTGLYNEIESQVNDNSITANTANTTLLNYYIRPCLLYYSIYESVEDIHYKLSPTGLQIQQPLSSNPAKESEVDRMKNKYFRKAESKANDLRKFLIQNSTTYPLYNNPGNGYDTVHPSNRPYDSGMYLGWGNNQKTGYWLRDDGWL